MWRAMSEGDCFRRELNEEKKKSRKLLETLQTIVDSYEATSELFTNDADLAANLHDHAKLAIKRYHSR